MTSRPPATPLPRAAAGLTLLEVLLAVALMALIAAGVLSGITAIDAMQSRSKMVLAASEVGNRLMLQYLDNEDSLPPRSQPISYGPYSFFYEITNERVTMDLNQQQRTGDNRPNETGLGRFEQITITVFEGASAAGQLVPVDQVAQLSRIFDPFAMRNAETVQGFDRDPNRLERLMRRIGQMSGQGGPAPTSPSTGP